MRIRIALTTAVAVIAIPAVLFTLFSSTPAASARVTRHEAVSQHRAVKIDMKLMSYAQAEKVAKLVTYSNAVAAQEQTTYLKDVAFLQYLKEAELLEGGARQQAAGGATGCGAAAAAASGGSGGRRCGSAPAPRQPRRRPRSGAGAGRLVGCHQHRHGGLGLHPCSTSRVTTTARATVARTSSSSGRGTR